MDEQNKVPEEQNIEESKEEVREQDNSVLENVGTSEPVAEIPVPKAPKPKLPLIIGGIVTGVAAVAVSVALVLGGGSNNQNADGNPSGNSHEHSFGEWSVVSNATCVANGKEERVCDCGEKDSRAINALGHKEVIDNSVKPTCESTGLTVGKHCSVCNSVIVSQTTVGKIPHTYDDKYDEKCNVCGFERDAECAHTETETIPGKTATCTATGLTDGEKCKKCGEILVAQTSISIIPHTYDDKYDENCNVCGFVRDAECAHSETETIPGKVATCTATGLTDGKKCKKCGEIITAQSIIQMKDHTEIVDAAVAATCTETGLTEGKHCSVCNKIIVAQTDVAATGHTHELTASTNSTCTKAGSETYTCIKCGDSYSNELAKLPHTYPDAVDATPVACKSCGNLKPSEGLRFSSVSGGYSVTGIGSCKDSIIVIPETYNGKPVVLVDSEAFYNRTSLTGIAIPSSVTTIRSSAFYGCSNLAAVYITDIAAWCNIDFYYYHSNPLYFAKKLYLNNELVTDFVIPEGVESIRKYAFNYCTGLTSITIPDSVTSIGSYAFSGCESLTSINIPDSVTSIDSYAFSDCSSLTSITIPNSVTSIGSAAFNYCTGLTNITIPNSVTSMGSYVFQCCDNLKDIYIGFAIIPPAWESIWGSWLANCSATVHYFQCEQHTWQEATCKLPKVCTVCLLTQGNPIEHAWKEATCTEPKTCSYCGVTDGKSLGHSYSEPWSCTEPNTCSICQETTVGHDWKAATCTSPKTCLKCNTTSGSPLTHVLDQSGVCYLCYQTVRHTVSLDNNFGKTISVNEGLINFTIDGDLVGVASSITIYGPVSNLVGTLTFSESGSSVYNCDFVSGYTSSPLISGTYTIKFSYYSSYDLVVRGGRYVRVGKGAITTKTIYLQVV